MDTIPVSGPWITEREIAYVSDAVANAWYDQANVYHERFERAFAEYVGRRYAIALPSCTSAIHLALRALNIGPEDEVIVPEITWIASAAPISYVGATPVFADVDPDTWCLSVPALELCITARTKAILPVNLYGGMPDMKGLAAIAERHNLAIIEDAAQAVGAEWRGKRAGSFGDVSVFSFHGSKTLTTGEGGMLVTDREEIRDRVLFLRDHGRRPGNVQFLNDEVAYKYKMSAMQAALGLAQLERVEELVARKREIFAWYRAELSGVPGLILNTEPPETRNTFWMVTAILSERYSLPKQKLIRRMQESGIACRPFFHPLSSLPAYSHIDEAGFAGIRNTISYQISPYGINLPSGYNMTPALVKRVCDTFKAILNTTAQEAA